MKLLKKIIPLATIASTALIVAPLVTSCSQNVFVDILKYDYNYEPILLQPESPDTETPAQETIEKAFFNVLKNKTEIFADEINAGLKNLVLVSLVAELKYRVNELKTSIYGIKYDDQNKKIDFALDIRGDLIIPNYTTERRISDYHVNGRSIIQFKNLSMAIQQYWAFAGEDDWEVKDEGAIVKLGFVDDSTVIVQESDEYNEVSNNVYEHLSYNVKFTKDNLKDNLSLNAGAVSWFLTDLRMERFNTETEKPEWIYYSHLLSAFDPNQKGWKIK